MLLNHTQLEYRSDSQLAAGVSESTPEYNNNNNNDSWPCQPTDNIHFLDPQVGSLFHKMNRKLRMLYCFKQGSIF
jgi:hypothetical protein